VEEAAVRVEDLSQSGGFDGDWYAARYPDVASSGLTPVDHYLRYGGALGRDPGPNFSATFYNLSAPPAEGESGIAFFRYLQNAAHGVDRMEEGRILHAAAALEEELDYDRALAIASKNIPEHLRHTLAMLEANRYARLAEWTSYADALNAYLRGARSPEIRLSRASGNIINDLTATEPPGTVDGPLVSVLMTAFNAEETIEAAVRSVLSQTWRNLEVLIVDDGSTDETWARLRKLQRSDARVSVYRNPVNSGAYVSKNIACRLSRGGWITCQDADDWCHPRRIEDHVRFATERAAAVSVMRMVRLRSDGICASLSPVSRNSPDGVAKEAPISALFRRDFFEQKLGAWDVVKVGGDSEILHRARTVAPSAYADFPYVGLICLDSPGGLTGDPVLGISHLSGPTGPRRAYVEAWKAWHDSLDAEGVSSLPFPRHENQQRRFVAPPPFVVQPVIARRSYAAIAGVQRSVDAPATMVCVSKRPDFAMRIARMMDEQVYSDLRVVFVADGYDADFVRSAFRNIERVTVLNVPPGEPLGVLLNRGVAASETDIVAKIDDDDYYGPNYIKRAVAALMFNEHEHVGLTGKALAFCHVERSGAFGMPSGGAQSNALVDFVFGGTLLWSREKTSNREFLPLPFGEDQTFCRQLREDGLGIWSSDPYDYVYVRRGEEGGHASSIADHAFESKLSLRLDGFDLAVAYS
jgi:glycosyltransferase involved in cell wall biosynthesis